MLYMLFIGLLLNSGPTVLQSDSLLLEDFHAADTRRDTISFTFNMPIDTSVHYRETGPLGFWQVLPVDSVQIDSVFFSDSLREVHYLVSHNSPGDFTWVLENARSRDSTYLMRTYTKRYSLGADVTERYSVSGRVILGVVTKRQPSRNHQDQPTSYRLDTLKGPALHYSYPIIVLANKKPNRYKEAYNVSPSPYLSVGQAFIPDYKDYNIVEVPRGVYWPVLLIRNSISDHVNYTDYAGYYYGDNFEDPDSIVVDNGSLSGINFSILYGDIEKSLTNIRNFKLGVYPNPFNPETHLRLQIAHPGTYSVQVYSILGRKVRTIITDKYLDRGAHTFKLDLSGHASGIYTVTVGNTEFRKSRVISFIK